MGMPSKYSSGCPDAASGFWLGASIRLSLSCSDSASRVVETAGKNRFGFAEEGGMEKDMEEEVDAGDMEEVDS